MLVIADGTEVKMNTRHIRLNRMGFNNLNMLVKTEKLINQPPSTRLRKAVFGIFFFNVGSFWGTNKYCRGILVL